MARRSIMKKAIKRCKTAANSAFLGTKRRYGHLDPDQKFNVKVLGTIFGVAAFVGLPGIAIEETRLAAQAMANASAQTGAIINENQKQINIRAAVSNAQVEALINGTACNTEGSVGVIEVATDNCNRVVGQSSALERGIVVRFVP